MEGGKESHRFVRYFVRLVYNTHMKSSKKAVSATLPSSTGSFFKFAAGFMIFIGVSFGVTLAVTHYGTQIGKQQAAAAALTRMLQ